MRKIASMALAAILAIAIGGCEQQNQGQAPIQAPQGPNPLNLSSKIESLESILSKDPKNLNALVELGNAYMDTNQFKKAISSYQKALDIDPTLSNVRTDMGTCQRRSGRSDLAAATFREVISKDPKHPYAHLNLGIVMAYDIGDFEVAIREFESFLELAPADPNAPAVRSELQRLKGITGSHTPPKS